ncbi:uncharacterized protein LOC125192506 [Salvia hispanica]|uniref:uncharacterized protein LOC125192506 n=1 Tax=Salvia hispanica TaxID=49212 RepID=UPI0020096849|nr:uncharacterized protein LOC125192506 [Salvia hispanica]
MWIAFSTKKLLVSRVFPTVYGWTSEKLRQREKMELESSDTIGSGSVVERGDPEKLPRPSMLVVFEAEESEPKEQLETAMEAFADASDDAVRGLENLVRSMDDLTDIIKNFEAMKLAASTACNMMGIIPEVEVGEEETVASMKTALAKDKLNAPELIEVVQRMIKITAQLNKLTDQGPSFELHPSFVVDNVS